MSKTQPTREEIETIGAAHDVIEAALTRIAAFDAPIVNIEHGPHGIQYELDNGIVVSVAWGPGTYSNIGRGTWTAGVEPNFEIGVLRDDVMLGEPYPYGTVLNVCTALRRLGGTP